MNKIVKISFLIFVLAFFSCKGQNQSGEAKALVLSSFKVGDSLYNKGEKKISITKATLTEGDLKDVTFTDEAGKVVSGVNWKMDPDRVRPNPEGKFKIVVSIPPSGYKAYTSDEITVVRELVPPKVLSIFCHGESADVSKEIFTVRIPKPTVTRPMTIPGGQHYGDISIKFDKEVPENLIVWEGLPGDAGNPVLKPEEVAHVTIKVPEKAGSYRAGEYRLDITFDTPTLSIKSLEITDQDGDTDLKELKVNVKNSKTTVADSDVKLSFKGEYIEATELSSIVPTYEGLPLNDLEVSKAKTFKVKVAAKPNIYKAFEATVKVVRANQPLTLTKLTILTKEQTDLNMNPFTADVDTMKTYIEKGDIKATFKKPDNTTFDVDCLLKGDVDNKIYLNAGVDNLITFYVPATSDYAEYRNQVKIKHSADWTKMIDIPMPDGGATFKSGNRDDMDKKIERKFQVGQFPVTYKLFLEVCDWAISGDGKDKGYTNIDKLKACAQNGAIRDEGKQFGTGHPEDSNVMPVCAITYHGAIVWCNMYSEKMGYAPAYYKPETGKIDVDWHTPSTKPDWTLYTSFTPTITVASSLSKEEISKLALRDAIENHDYHSYTDDQWNKIRDNYYKAAILTAKQAKFDDEAKSGYRLIDTLEWEFVARLRKTKTKNCTDSSLIYNGTTYYFANKDCAPGSDGYGNDGSEIEKVAWVSGNSSINGKLQTHPIGHRIPTDLGFYDLAGNVGSWTNTWSKYNGTDGEKKTDYNLYAVGGGFCDNASRCTVNSLTPSSDGRYDQCGIRLCRTLK